MKPTFAKQLALFIYKKTNKYILNLKRNRNSTKAIFNVDVKEEANLHYDITTLLIRRTLKHADNPEKLLEMGLGCAGLISIGYAKETNKKVYGIDISEEKVKSSIDTAIRNKVKYEFIISDLFTEAHGKYDCIIFNPPYISSGEGRSLNITEKLGMENELSWNGGEKGTEVLEKFLSNAGDYLNQNGCILVGTQDIYISREEFQDLVNKTELKKVAEYKKIYIPMTTVHKLMKGL